MGHIWNDYENSKYFYALIESPYMEVWDSSQERVGVNIDIRLDSLFFPQKDIGDSDKTNNLYKRYEEDPRYKDIFNLICHYAAQSDRLRGITYKDFVEIIIDRQITTGMYGDKTRDKYMFLSEKDRRKLCRSITKYECSSGRELQIDAAIKYLFDEVNLYYEQSTKMIRVCVNQKKSVYNQNLFDLACYFFQDIETEIEVYWLGEHFGIIGIDETMQIDRTALI